MWKKVPRQTTKSCRESFRRKIEPAVEMADAVTSYQAGEKGSLASLRLIASLQRTASTPRLVDSSRASQLNLLNSLQKWFFRDLLTLLIVGSFVRQNCAAVLGFRQEALSGAANRP
jgi:hypothetical protein